MRIEIHDAEWLPHRQGFTLTELADLSGLAESELRGLVDYELLTPMDPASPDIRFDAYCVAVSRRARRLRDDFDLDEGALALALALLNRIQELEEQVRALHAQIPADRHYP